MDHITPDKRSEIMRRVRAKNTKPEMVVRRLIYALGYRFRLHVKNLPGTPDLVFSSRRKIIFVHGCFWHFHLECARARLPKSRQDYWKPKLNANRNRDARNELMLIEKGWKVLIIWECELVDLNALAEKIRNFLDTD